MIFVIKSISEWHCIILVWSGKCTCWYIFWPIRMLGIRCRSGPRMNAYKKCHYDTFRFSNTSCFTKQLCQNERAGIVSCILLSTEHTVNIITACQRSCGKVMFWQVSLILLGSSAYVFSDDHLVALAGRVDMSRGQVCPEGWGCWEYVQGREYAMEPGMPTLTSTDT